MSTFIYLRVADGANSDLNSAEEACREFAARRGWEVTDTYRDITGGMDNDRSGYVRLKEAIAAGEAARVITTSPQMLTRDYAEGRRLARLADEHGAKLYGVWGDFSLMGADLAETDAAMAGRTAVPHVDEPGDERVEVRVMLTFDTDAELVFGNRTPQNPLRVPAVDIVRDTGIPFTELPGARLTAVVTEDPEHGQRVTAYRRA
ncbi:recombinase family protein [Actinomadura sp. 3N508]|uniref:recombinase family protein n=1 Tax=Actinomadura sp. 3N508 TaxID=3375153 RepID=UPI0037B14E68